jgi:hypothetical protein
MMLAFSLSSIRSELEVKRKVSVPTVYAAVLLGISRCDAGSSVYLQQYSPTGTQPILKVSRDGQRTVRFSVDAVPGLQAADIVNFAPDRSGQLFLLVNQKEEHFVARFDRDGKYVSRFRTPEPLLPTGLAVFSSGDFLLSGYEVLNGSSQTRQLRPMLALVDDDGRLIRRVGTGGSDIQHPQPPKHEPVDDPRKSPDVEFAQAIGGSVLESGDDGNVYVMRGTPQGPILVVSAAGELLRTLRLTPPEGFRLREIKVAPGRIAAVYTRRPNRNKGEKTSAVTIAVIDAVTGEKQAEYFHQSPELGLGLACYTPDNFTFVGADRQGYLELIHAAAK